MKTQFSFLHYIAHMTRASIAFLVRAVSLLIMTGATFLGLVSGEGFVGLVFGLMLGFALSIFVGTLAFVFGLIVGFALSLIVSLVAFIFFSPENIFDQRFQIVSFAIIATFIILLFSILHNLIAENYPVTIWEIGLVVVIIPVIMSAHRLASRDLVATVEKRKEKQI
ncbi:MAG: hypothetical protein Phog2KO_30870 [Phototrophicaceae bacterium]